MNKFQILIKINPYDFLRALHEKDDKAHGAVLCQTYPGAYLAITTDLTLTDVEKMEGVAYAQISTY